MGISGNDLTAAVTAFILICIVTSGVHISCHYKQATGKSVNGLAGLKCSRKLTNYLTKQK